jgi:Protein of unknown function (DUF3455)
MWHFVACSPRLRPRGRHRKLPQVIRSIRGRTLPTASSSSSSTRSGSRSTRARRTAPWLFTDPEATLYKTTGVSRPIGTHFLNFATGRPVWQLKDDSSVEAARTVTVSGGTGNIAWLLLQAVVTTAGSDGDRLTSTTWVQRLNTSGGVAPAETCVPGDRIAVPYSADYFFWRAAGGDDSAG